MKILSRYLIAALIFAFIIGATLVSAIPESQVIHFTNVSEDVGISTNDYASASGHVLGIDWIDYDNDNYPDLFLVNGWNHDPHLYHNEGDGTFTNADNLLPAFPNLEMAGTVFADYDNDGDLDIYIQVANEQFELFGVNEPDGPANILLQNQFVENGNAISTPLFIDVAAAAGVDNLATPPLGPDYPGHRSMTGGWLDYNRDGCQDLYVGQMVLQAQGEISNLDTFYENNCDGTFSDATTAAGLPNTTTVTTTYRAALAFIGAHLDNDLWPDMYTVHVHHPTPFHYDFIYQNNQDSTFTDLVPSMPGIGDDSGSGMGIDVGDIDLDGDWDIYMSDVFNSLNDSLPLGNTLYLNNGDGTWSDNSAPQAGVDGAFSWGVNFFDLNNDRYEDLFVAAQPTKILYLNNQDAPNVTFDNITSIAGIITGGLARGSAIADYDRDGDLDIAVVHEDGDIELWQNNSTNLGNWIEIKLSGDGVNSSTDAIGAVVKITDGGQTVMRQVKGGSSAHSQDDLVMHFGLGDTDIIDAIEINWPSGLVQILNNVPVGFLLEVTEGQAPSIPAPTPTPSVPTPTPTEAPIEIIIDDTDSGFSVVNFWQTNTSNQHPSYLGEFRLATAGDGSNQAIYTPNIAEAGNYEVFVWYFTSTGFGSNVPYTITHRTGSTLVEVNHLGTTGEGGYWMSLGTYEFDAGTTGNVTISNNADGFAPADAIRFLKVPFEAYLPIVANE